jgi:hypothetical protein
MPAWFQSRPSRDGVVSAWELGLLTPYSISSHHNYTGLLGGDSSFSTHRDPTISVGQEGLFDPCCLLWSFEPHTPHILFCTTQAPRHPSHSSVPLWVSSSLGIRHRCVIHFPEVLWKVSNVWLRVVTVAFIQVSFIIYSNNWCYLSPSSPSGLISKFQEIHLPKYVLWNSSSKILFMKRV